MDRDHVDYGQLHFSTTKTAQTKGYKYRWSPTQNVPLHRRCLALLVRAGDFSFTVCCHYQTVWVLFWLQNQFLAMPIGCLREHIQCKQFPSLISILLVHVSLCVLEYSDYSYKCLSPNRTHSKTLYNKEAPTPMGCTPTTIAWQICYH